MWLFMIWFDIFADWEQLLEGRKKEKPQVSMTGAFNRDGEVFWTGSG